MAAEKQVSAEQVPGEVRYYMEALQPHFTNPFVRQHFRQITCLRMNSPDQGGIDFFALEFQVGQEGALIWFDGVDQWSGGGWLPLAHADADLASPPTSLTMEYFQNAKPHPSLQAALEALIESD